MKKVLLATILIIKISFIYSQPQSIFKKAQEEFAKQNYNLALQYFQEAAQAFEKNNDHKNLLVCNIYINEINLITYQLDGLPEKIRTLYNQSSQLFGENHPNSITILTQLGKYYFLVDSTEKSKSYYQKAFYAFNQTQDYLRLAKVCLDLSNIFFKQNSYDSSLYYINYALKKPTSIDFITLASLETMKASIFIEKKYLDSANVLTNQLLETLDNNNLQYTELYARNLLNTSKIYKDQNQLEIAENLATSAINISNSINSIKLLNEAYMLAGEISMLKENWDNAIGFFTNSYQLTKKYPQNIDKYTNLVFLNYLGILFLKKQMPEKSIFFLQESLKIAENCNYCYFEKAIIYQNIATSFLNLKDTLQALTYYLKAYEKLAIWDTNQIFTPKLLINIANIFLEKKQYDSALFYYQKCINSKLSNRQEFIEAINGILVSNIQKKEFTKSLEYISWADTAIENIRSTMITDEDKIAFNEKISKFYNNAILTLIKLYEKDKAYKENIHYFIERSKSQTLISNLAFEKTIDTNNTEIKEISRLRRNLFIYTNIIKSSINTDEINFYHNLTLKTLREISQLLEKIPYYKISTKIVSLEKLQKNLDDSSAFLNYYIGTNILAVVYSSNISSLVYFKNIDSSIYEKIKIFNFSIKSNIHNVFNNYIKSAHELYKELFFFPIPENIKKIFISPHKYLNNTSFEALLTEKIEQNTTSYENFPYLLKKYNIIYEFSATYFDLLKNLQNPQINRKDILVLAPVFDTKPKIFNNSTVTPIPYSLFEVQKIKDIFTKNNLTCQTLIEDNATEYLLKALLKSNNYRIIHIATHGLANYDNPMNSCLILYEDSLKVDDGILYAYEIAAMSIKSDLVVLSACETASGKVYEGEGIVGFSYTLALVGAKGIILTLWPISDLATSEFMKIFYEKTVNSSKTFYEILYQTKLYFLNTQFSHPFYWAPFVYFGI